MKLRFSHVLLTVLVVFSATGESAAYEEFTQDDIAALLQVRPLLFGGSELQAALEQSTISGEQAPIFGYDLADRALIAWRIDDHMAGAFAQAIGLPPHMALAKVSSITERKPHGKKARHHRRGKPKSYLMLVDIANAERFLEGTIVEWKTFVTVGDDPAPRLLRFDVQRAVPGTDLLDVFTPPFGAVQWGVDNDRASGLVTNGQDALLSVSIPLKTRHGRPGGFRFLRFSEEFLTAGERTFSTLGSQARYYYDGSSVSAKFLAFKPHDVDIVNTFAWAAFAGELASVSLVAGKTEHLVQPIGLPVAPGSFESGLFAQLTGMVLGGATPEDVFATLAQASGSPSYPTLYYGVLHLYQALQIFAGQELPKMVFSLKRAPKTVFINFEIPARKAAAFKQAFLPEHFELAKMRFYPEQKKPVYAVSLNIYDAVGQSVRGFRAEWSTYVINPNEENPQPRFSILEAQTASFGLDPIGVLDAIRSGRFNPDDLTTLLEGPAEVFEFTLDEATGLDVDIVDIAEGIEVDISVPYPAGKDILRTRPMKRWMEANDFVYWGEAADILKYDSNVMYADMIVFKPGRGAVIRDNVFSGYVNPRPLPIILWDGIQDIALEPWGNVQDIVPVN